jgi:hypothetical protein
LRLSVTTLLAPGESAEHEAQVRRKFASVPESGCLSGNRRSASSESTNTVNLESTLPDVASSDYLDTAGNEVLRALNA